MIPSIQSPSDNTASPNNGFNPSMLLSQVPQQLPRNPSLMPTMPLPSFTPPTSSAGDVAIVSAPTSDPAQLSPEREAIMKAANSSLGLNAGVGNMCAHSVRHILSKAGITNVGETSNPWDGVQPSTAGFANSFAGDNVGQRKTSLNDMKPGDLVLLKNTTGNYAAGTITHVGIYAGKDPKTGDHMMFDHSSRRGVVKRSVEDTFPGQFAGGVDLKAVTNREMARQAQPTEPKIGSN